MLVAVAALVIGCVARPKVPTGLVHHAVVCWTKDPDDAAARAQLIDVTRSFLEIPGVLDVRVGERLDAGNPAADETFQVALVMVFADRAALDAYLEHPRHREAVDEVLRPLASRIVVYDFVDQ